MPKFNSEVKKGRVGKTPLLILLLITITILILANFAIESRNEQNNHHTAKTAAKSDLVIAANQIAKMERQSLINKKNTVTDDKTLSFDSMATSEDQENTEKNRDGDFQKDYEEYLRFENNPQPVISNPAPDKIKEKRSSDFEKALSAPTKVNLKFSPNLVNTTDHSSNGYQYLTPDQVNELKRARESLENLPTNSETTSGTLSDYEYLKNDDFKLAHQVESVSNPFVLKQGSVIPAVLLTGINSELPGQISAQITADVLDSPFGNNILIPKGSKLIGQYGSNPQFGQSRVMLGFNRLIFPDGKSLNLSVMPGSGPDGYSGFEADVDNHWLKLISYSVFLGGITTAVTLSTDTGYDSDGKITPQAALSQSMGEILGRTMSQVIERHLNLSPTLKVKPGFRFNLTVTKDIEFSGEYTAYDYLH
ncbi:TrbI/VirB10 family protein [Succinatimonas hippei]|uniref:Bacterial conjugation TrbI-like protein n=1 Tax=Succinatimonas hippei (strain DSM 22608 / JCM 16073 / KCTC 15190 / YIT 12066) TaxID=762983 RepID=E8LKH4_SUCHY|nr:TrbI/VirB10 family protein [Succinatimonas hippei]EFY06961.1 bacterial conjugation TrbI-like protein [Succinatimonas hippei YIT 12066]